MTRAAHRTPNARRGSFYLSTRPQADAPRLAAAQVLSVIRNASVLSGLKTAPPNEMHEEAPTLFMLRYHPAVAGLPCHCQGRSSLITCLLFRVPGPFANVGYASASIP